MRGLFTAMILTLLAGCAATGGLEGVSLITTDKLVSDHVVSAISGKNCSRVRTARGQTYCEEDELNPLPNAYCYPNLGGITCYDRPVFDGQQQRVGHIENNTIDPAR